MDGYLSDTSIFVAAEQGRDLGAAPEGRARISVATLTELRIGVGMAGDRKLRAVREATLAKAQSFIPLPYDEHVSNALASLHVAARRKGRRAPAEDAIIAATALVHDLAVWTQDDDFEVLAELEPKLRVHRT